MDLATAQAKIDNLMDLQKQGKYEEGGALFEEGAIAELPLMMGTITGKAEIIKTWEKQDLKGKFEKGETPEVGQLEVTDTPNCFKRLVTQKGTMMNTTLTQTYTFSDSGLISKMSTAAFG
ncbi:hypothetical protein CYMTET_38726 [Cymbomonas tetramitiformis]|uniref:Uncharacterized protein n=1 Tax=Cymbomonas tetramitiformis TaxID=36881 RepID=A0AAE0CCV1_9CHLO|nr:hypothetical protein CYMTET_38726 [Cymbomonas tetramitiformis]|eukprot:gene25684-31410_t